MAKKSGLGKIIYRKIVPRIRERLDPIFIGPEKEINIFIHGYGAVPSREDFDSLTYNILSARPRGQIYLLYWKSGDWKLPPYVATTATVLRRGYKVIKAGKAAMGPVALALTAGELFFEYVILKIAQFKYYERRSEQLGRNFKRRIAALGDTENLPINLIGHSLGARVIHYALAYNDWSKYKLKDCIFLGGAADVDDDWDDCISGLKGRIYNAYSKKDRILWITPDLRSRVGRYPIEAKSKKIVNRHYPSFRHTDYWPNLEYVLDRLWPNFKQSQNRLVVIEEDIYCPHCEEVVEIKGDGKYECESCGLDFDVEGDDIYF